MSLIFDPVVIGAAIGFALFFFGLDPSGELGPETATVSGLIGGFIGAVCGIPLHLMRQSRLRQDVVENREGILLEDPEEVTGMWKYRRSLVIDPEIAQFPARCIFTNDSVDELLPFTIVNLDHSVVGSVNVTSKETRYEFLPISKSWLEQQKGKSALLQKVCLLASLAMFLIGVFLCYASPKNEEVKGMLFTFSFLSFVVGLALPQLAGFNGKQEIYTAHFFKDGRILIRNPHREFIADLPELTPGLLHGLLGIEELLNKHKA